MSDNTAIHRDAFHMLVEERLGSGIGRTVWSSEVLPGCVVKVEENARSFQNVIEFETWHRVKGTEFERWFAPCRWISPNGSVLVMERTTTATNFPARMPVFLTDFKRRNYGLLKGKLVCHDYGTNLLFERGMSRAMKRADWWD